MAVWGGGFDERVGNVGVMQLETRGVIWCGVLVWVAEVARCNCTFDGMGSHAFARVRPGSRRCIQCRREKGMAIRTQGAALGHAKSLVVHILLIT